MARGLQGFQNRGSKELPFKILKALSNKEFLVSRFRLFFFSDLCRLTFLDDLLSESLASKVFLIAPLRRRYSDTNCYQREWLVPF